MTAPRRPNRTGEPDRDRDAGGEKGDEPPRRRRDHPHDRGRERAVFLDYVTRRWTGSSPPSAEAYARAERLWRQLPGAVITPPTDLGEPPVQPRPADGGGEQPS